MPGALCLKNGKCLVYFSFYTKSQINHLIVKKDLLFLQMCADLEHSPLTARYVAEINRIWELLQKSYNNIKHLGEIIKDQIHSIATVNAKLTVAGETSKGEQKSIEKLTQV